VETTRTDKPGWWDAALEYQNKKLTTASPEPVYHGFRGFRDSLEAIRTMDTKGGYIDALQRCRDIAKQALGHVAWFNATPEQLVQLRNDKCLEWTIDEHDALDWAIEESAKGVPVARILLTRNNKLESRIAQLESDAARRDAALTLKPIEQADAKKLATGEHWVIYDGTDASSLPLGFLVRSDIAALAKGGQ